MLKKQIVAFLIIGVLASITNMLIVFLLVHFDFLIPLMANVIAYLIAFNVSYFGHRAFTFLQSTQPHKTAVVKFFINVMIGLGLSEILYYIFLHILYVNYLIALFITMVLVAVYTFISSKILIFKA